MNARRIGTRIGGAVAFGLGYGKAGKIDRPPAYSQEMIYGDVIRLDDDKREESARSSIYFYSNMRVLSQKIGSADLRVLERKGEAEEHIYDHPFEQLFRRPNDLMSRSDLMEHSMWWLGLDGNAYWYLTTDTSDELAELWPLPANEVKPVPDKDEVIKGYNWMPGGRRLPMIPKEKICHFRMVNPFSVTEGMSFVDALKYALAGSEARFKWELAFFSDQRAVPEGLLSVDPMTDDTDLERIREELRQAYGGDKRGIAVGKAGQMSFTRFALTQEEMAFLERLQYDEKLFDRVFGFPGGYWDAKANRANAEQAERSLAQDTVMPILNKFAGNIESQILDRYYQAEGQDLTCEFDDVTPDDRETTVNEFNAFSNALTFDEARMLAGYTPIEGQLGMMPFALMDALAQMVGQGFTAMPQVEQKALAAADARQAQDDLRNWKQVALKQLAKGESPAARPFYSDHIPPTVAERINADLEAAESDEDVRAAFMAWSRPEVLEAWRGYP